MDVVFVNILMIEGTWDGRELVKPCSWLGTSQEPFFLAAGLPPPTDLHYFMAGQTISSRQQHIFLAARDWMPPKVV